MKPDSRKALVDAIAQEERHMADLADEARRASERLVALRASLDARVASPPEQSDAPASATKVREPWHPRTSSEKVGVFRTLFRGRADVFPVRFMSKRGTLVQYSGRLHRLHPGKTDVRVVDYVDREVPMLLRMFRRRLRGYQAIGYAPSKEPPGQRTATASLVVEYDEPH